MPQVRYVDDGSSSGTPADSDSDAATSPESDSGSEFGSDGEDGSPMARKRPAKVAPKRRVGHLTVRRALACLSVAGARARLLLVTQWCTLFLCVCFADLSRAVQVGRSASALLLLLSTTATTATISLAEWVVATARLAQTTTAPAGAGRVACCCAQCALMHNVQLVAGIVACCCAQCAVMHGFQLFVLIGLQLG